jgi:transposase-like protein
MLRKADIELSRGQKVGKVCREVGITEQTYYRWRREFGGMKASQAKRLKALEMANSRLKGYDLTTILLRVVSV